MPSYSLADFQNLVRTPEFYCFNKRRPHDEMDKLGWESEDLKRMLYALEAADFQKTVPNCRIHDLPGYDFIDADQYAIYWDETAGMRRNEPLPGTVALSMKIAIVTDEDGTCAGIVTFHVST